MDADRAESRGRRVAARRDLGTGASHAAWKGTHQGRLVRVNAFAKINLALQVLGARRDGYHELRTTFQTVALHDTLIFSAVRGPFEMVCDDPACPVDCSNLVWRAAERLWRAAGRRGAPAGVRVRLAKRIPLQAGLGGGSSDAAAALRALARLWRVTLGPDRLRRIASRLGADVPFFLEGGTVLGLKRGDLLRPLADGPASWVVLVLPNFGVSAKDAYGWWDGWWDAAGRPALRSDAPPAPEIGRRAGRIALRGNDLEGPVAARHPDISRVVAALRRSGARHAAMSGSGSAIFGLFDDKRAAETAARLLGRPPRRALVTRTLGRTRYRMRARLRVWNAREGPKSCWC
jgi:4-diphosphocytidyl-2-C-methyl-D-erythritol kinase